MAPGGGTNTKTGTLSFSDVPWINVTVQSTTFTSAFTFSIVFTKPSGNAFAANLLERGGAASMASYEIDVTSDGGTTWNMIQNQSAASWPITYTQVVPSQYYTFNTNYMV